MTTLKIQTLYIFILFFLPLYIYGGNPHIINLTKDVYKADNKNWSIDQDERGILYVGNDVGLLEFDGIEWNLNVLPHNLMVRSVAALSHETVFTGSYEEFGRWDRDGSGQMKYTSLSDRIDRKLLKNNDFWKIHITDQYVLFQSFPSVFVYDYENVISLPVEMNLLFLSQVRDEFLVQEMIGPLYRLKRNLTWEMIPGSEIFNGMEVRVILPYGTDQYLIGTATDGIYIYDGFTFKEWSPVISERMKSRELNCGIVSSQGTYYLGTILDGIYEVDPKGTILNHISSVDNLQNNTVLALYEDNLQNIWAALDRGLSYVYHLENMSCFTDPGGNTGAIYDAALWNGYLYLGTNQGLFFIPEEELKGSRIFRNMKLVDGTQGQVWSLKVIDNRLFCGHNRTFKEITPSGEAKDLFDLRTGIYDISEMQIKNKDMYALSTYSSLILVDKQTEELFFPAGIPEPINYAVTDHLDNIWLQHFNKGVYRCRPEDDFSGFRNISYYGGDMDDGLPFHLTLFKVGGRVVMVGDDYFFTYDDIQDRIVPDSLLNDCFRSVKNIRKVKSISSDLFWAITDRAIYKFYYDGYKASVLESYDLENRFSLVYSYENITIVNDSVHIVCLDNGFLLHTHSQATVSGQTQPLPVPWLEGLTATNIQGKKVYKDISSPVSIPYDHNSINFGFAVNNIFVSGLSLQYKLENMDSEWSEPQRINQVNYVRLPEGKYRFLVRTTDKQGQVSKPLSYEFRILSPWYRSFWAILLYIAIAGSLLYLFWLLLLKRYRNLHLQKIRYRETKRLRKLAGELQYEVERKNAELLTQTSFIIQKNELIMKMKDIIDEFYFKNRNTASTQFYQKINNHLNNAMNSEDDWKMFLIKFEEKHTHFFKQMKILYPELTTSDLRLCACLKLNMETKEIASLMNLSVKAIENNRYRLRKKLKLSREQNLSEFLMNV